MTSMSRTKKIILSALLLALAIVVNRFRIVIPFGGVPFLKLSLSGPLLKLVAIAIGPMYGGLVPALSDFIGAMTNPIGGYVWLFTVVAFVKGWFTGWLWKITNSLFICVTVPCVLGSIANSLIMRYYLMMHQKVFMGILITRLTEEIFVVIFNIIMLKFILKIYERYEGCK